MSEVFNFTCVKCLKDVTYKNDKWVNRCLFDDCKKPLCCFSCQRKAKTAGLKTKEFGYCENCETREIECAKCGRPVVKPHKWNDDIKVWSIPDQCWVCEKETDD